jgi:uncharacterized protein YyaL (SSP411 family)
MRTRRQILRAGTGLACAALAPRALAGEPEPVWLTRARAVMDAIQKDLADPTTGGYFQSTDKHDPEFMWGNGVMFSALVAAARHDPAWKPIFSRFFTSMDRSWDKKAKVPGYEPAPIRGESAPHDKYYDDNQWMVITFMEAYDLTKEARYLARAQEVLEFALSGWDDRLGGGIWWHEGRKDGTKNTCSNGPAAVACLRVARRHDAKGNLEWARRLVAWTNGHLQDTDGLFFDRVKAEDGRIIKGKLTYNAALMIRANLGLFRATKEDPFLAGAKRIAGACTHFVRPETGGYRDALRFSHLLVEADLELARTTRDESTLDRARKTAEAAWQAWEKSPPKELIERASLARMLWLLADAKTETGRAFWQAADTDRP